VVNRARNPRQLLNPQLVCQNRICVLRVLRLSRALRLLMLIPSLFLQYGLAQYVLTTDANPSGAGTVSGAGSYAQGTRVSVTATPALGYYFVNFSGGLEGAPNPQMLFMNASATVTANFAAVGTTPVLVPSVGSRTPSASQLTLDMRLTDNMGAGPANDAQITSITSIQTVGGSGTVSVVSAVPVNVGTLTSGQTSSADVTFSWPTSATEVQFTVNFSANKGAYTGSSNLNVLYTNEIKHIVIFIKENRSFDNYFGKFPGATGATSGTTSTGAVVPLVPAPDIEPSDLCHAYNCSITAMDNGKMDLFDQMSNPDPEYPLPPNLRSYDQFSENGIPNYWAYAKTYTLADHMFSSLAGPSFPNHLYTIAAQSGGLISSAFSSLPGQTYTLLSAWGCDSPDYAVAQILSPTSPQTITRAYPCFDFLTLGDLVDQASNPSITWKSYAPSEGQEGYYWNTYSAISHIRYGPDWSENVVPDTRFVTDAQNGHLPSLSWVVTPPDVSDHPRQSVCAGENDTVAKINAIMQGPQWGSTAILLTWDDFGGYYDSVAPPQITTFGLGIRLPLLIISPYAQPAYISHTVYSFESLLSFAENILGVPPLMQADVTANNLGDSFNFAQTPLPPLVLQARTCPTNAVTCPAGTGQVGVPYSSSVTPTNGVSPYTFLTTGEPLPPGLALNGTTGVISGTPTALGSFSYTAEAVDSTGTAAACINTITVAGATQTITFNRLSNEPIGTPPFTVNATASSGLAVSFASITPDVCTVSDTTVTLVAVGLCTIRASQKGNTEYAAATPVYRDLNVQATQTITFGALSNEPLNTPPFTISATASSGLTVAFYSQTQNKCTVSGSTVTLVAVGTCTIRARQPGNDDYAAAAPVDQSFQVTQ
jgi:phospholipase C